MSMNSPAIASPASFPRRRAGFWVVPLLLVSVVAAAAIGFRPWGGAAAEGVTGQFYTVAPIDLEMKIVKDGELASVRHTDVENKVESSTQILWLVKEGTTVKKGDELVRLDASSLQQRKDNLDLDVQKADSNLKISEEMKLIQEMQNSANKEAAEVAVQLAVLELQQYTEGTYPQQLQNSRTALTMANINLKNKEEDLAQTMSLFAKGFVTAAEVKKGELDVTNGRNEVKKAETALRVLTEYSNPMELARLKSAVAQAEQRLARTLRHNRSLLTQAEADLAEKQKSLELLKERAEKLQEQLDNCVIYAPEAGLVIYMSSIDRHMREPIQEGTTVRHGQTIIRLPDVRAMKAVLKISEAQKPKLDGKEQVRATVRILGVPKPVGATLTKVAVLPDGGRWWNPDLKEYPIELTLDETPEGLKPGTRVDAEILIDRFEDVLAVPLAAVYTVGTTSFVFVETGDGVKERRVRLGQGNETHVQVVSGLSTGERVLLLEVGQGRLLLEKAGVEVEEPTTRPARPEPEELAGL